MRFARVALTPVNRRISGTPRITTKAARHTPITTIGRRRSSRRSLTSEAYKTRPRYPEGMRLWLKDSERKPDPQPVVTDDRKAMLVGIVLWLVALVVLLVLVRPIIESGLTWLLWTCVAGIAIGLAGILYTNWRQKPKA